jgi:hypothetical protein
MVVTEWYAVVFFCLFAKEIGLLCRVPRLFLAWAWFLFLCPSSTYDRAVRPIGVWVDPVEGACRMLGVGVLAWDFCWLGLVGMGVATKVPVFARG